MKRMFPYIVLVIVAIIIFDKFDLASDTPSTTASSSTGPGSNVSTSQEVGKASTATAAAMNESYALRADDYSWPVLKDSNKVADSLLTKNYYLVIDGSGSMLEAECSQGSNKMTVAKQAFQTFVSDLPADANIGLYAFDKAGIGERVALGQHNREQLQQALLQISPGGGTPLSLSIADGYQALTAQASSQLGYGEYHLVVITDGLASSGYSPETDINNILASTPINIHTIGFCIDDQHPLNQPGYTFYRSANDPSSLQAGLQEVLAEAPDFTLTEFTR
jgi:Ca-activated chloride channel homolog